jgi:hypothetical protein
MCGHKGECVAPVIGQHLGVRRTRLSGSEPTSGGQRGKSLCLLGGLRRIEGRIKGMSEPTGKYSITMPRDVAEAAKARSGPSGLSAYVAAAVARQIERDNLNELITVAEAEHGPVTEVEIQVLRDQLHEARQQQTRGGANAA